MLPTPTRRALNYLAKQPWLKRAAWYLAGGTALALQVGHRASVDLDFFIPQADFSTGRLLDHFDKKIWKSHIVREGTVYGTILNAKASFIAYPFFKPKEPFHWYGNVRVLDQRDIAVMKIVAISQRGRKRDFVDLYWHLKNCESLADILERLHHQYPTVARNYHHILKSLVYFTDAEEDPMPPLFFKANWREIKIYFRREVAKLSKKFLYLQ